jgi:hypothetical protein
MATWCVAWLHGVWHGYMKCGLAKWGGAWRSLVGCDVDK